ncbi:MAG: exodeoxyribonuclease VII large subunit, partial [Saprospiraceae bacterium]|nr:exodeoxyribonuclease VII large subunit [Saprospiraceae bacterium]
MESLSLLELNEHIQRVYALNFPEALWVHFELSNVKDSRGNLYFDCVEKDDGSGEVVAHHGGAIWRRQLSFIKKKLGGIAKELLMDGVEISAKVQVTFHPRYGAKLIVEDIDPAYTYG